MGYTRNFGMRSFENIVRDGRFRVPRTGSPLLIGSPVLLDPAAPGFLKQAASGQAPGQHAGLVIYEHILAAGSAPHLGTVSDAPYNQVPLGQYAQMVHGHGAKVWFKNTADKPLYDGRNQVGGTMVLGDLSTLTPGSGIGVGANGQFTAASTGVWFVVEQVNPSTGLVEVRFTF